MKHSLTLTILLLLALTAGVVSAEDLTLVGQVNLPSMARGVFVSGDNAFVAGDAGGLYIIDISDRANPATIASLSVMKEVMDAAVLGDRAFATSYSSSLAAINIADPHTPILTGSVNLADHPNRVSLQGDYAYVASQWGGLRVVDISVTPPDEVGCNDCSVSAANNAIDLVVQGDYAYVVGGNGKGLKVYDISTPESPALVSTFGESEYFEGVSLANGYAFITNNKPDANNELWVVDVTNPASPAYVNKCTLEGNDHCGANTVKGGHAYVACHGTGLEVVDVTSPGSPTWLANYDTYGDVNDVCVVDGFVFLATSSSGLVILKTGSDDSKGLCDLLISKETLASADRAIGTYDTEQGIFSPVIPGYAGYADFSQNRDLIAYSSKPAPTAASEIYVMNLMTGEIDQLTALGGRLSNFPRFIDHNTIWFVHSSGAGHGEIFVVDVTSHEVSAITNVGAGGKEIRTFDVYDGAVYYSKQNSNSSSTSEIYRNNESFSSETQLTFNSRWDHYPVVSPDGSKLAFYRFDGSSSTSAPSNVYILDLATGEERRLTSSTSSSEEYGTITWSADMQYLYCSFRSGTQYDVVSVELATLAWTNLTNTTDYNENAALRRSACGVPPTTAFAVDPTSGARPLAVTFQDQSEGDITSWAWDFGDGAVSDEQSPTHEYTVAGLYDVSLTVSGPFGSSTEVCSSCIEVSEPEPTLADELIEDLEAIGQNEKVISGQFIGYISESCLKYEGDNCDPAANCECVSHADLAASKRLLIDNLACKTKDEIPAMIGIDLGWNNDWTDEHIDEIIDSVITWVQQGGEDSYLTISWHAMNPWSRNPDPTDLSQLGSSTDLTSSEGTHYLSFRDDLDRCAHILERFQDAGIPVLWRPFHEMNGNWFWWSNLADGPSGYQSLWRYVHDYMENTKNLRNLVWVYAVDDGQQYNDSYFPDSYVDVLGIDNYGGGILDTYYDLIGLHPNMPIGLSEFGGGPSCACERQKSTPAALQWALREYDALCYFQAWHRPWALVDYPNAARSVLWSGDVITNTYVPDPDDCRHLQFTKHCPVDLVVTDPLGRSISKTYDELPLASYEEYLLDNGDTAATATVWNPVDGIYEVLPVACEGAEPSSPYTIFVIVDDDTTFLAVGEMVSDIPPEGYRFSTLDTGSIAGLVSSQGVGLMGVPVDLYDSTSTIIASIVTDTLGGYFFAGLDNGFYTVSIATPLGYETAEEAKAIEVRGLPHEVNFELEQLNITPQQRTRGYWAHQLVKALQDKPRDYSLDDFASLAGLVDVHFNRNQLNPVDFYSVLQPADRSDSLAVLTGLLHMRNTGDWQPTPKRLANAQLMALMLNVVSGRVAQTYEISVDGRTISQAITYCDLLVNDEIDPPQDGGPGDGSPWCRYIRASFILLACNVGLELPAGMIPEDVMQIAYRAHGGENLPESFALHQNYPNPFNPATEISFSLPQSGFVQLEIYNVLGQKIETLIEGEMEAGDHTVTWDASQAASGIYLYRLRCDDKVASRKMVLLK